MNNVSFLTPGVYLQQPELFSPHIFSCACFLQYQGTYLFLQKAKGKWSEHLWGVPCGKMKKNEDIHKAMVREFLEETQISFSIHQLQYMVTCFIVQNDHIHNVHNIFWHELQSPLSVQLSSEHNDYQWFSKDAIKELPLIPYQYEVFQIFINQKIAKRKIYL